MIRTSSNIIFVISLSLCVAFSPQSFPFRRLHEYVQITNISLTTLCSSKTSSNHESNANSKKNNSPWKQVGDTIDPALCPLSKSEIISLITERNKARRSRNFELADSFLKKLQYNHVYLDDKKKLWRADGESFQQVPRYRKDPNSRPISAREEAYVQIKVQERAEAKFARKFNIADDILDELRFLKNVVVNDDTLTWRVTEAFKTVYEFGGKRLHNVPEETLRSIEQLIRERGEAKDCKNYKVADEILDILKEDYGVRVDDAKKAWFFLPKPQREMEHDMEVLNQEVTHTRYQKDEATFSNIKQSVRDRSELPLGISFEDDNDDDDDSLLPTGISLGKEETLEQIPPRGMAVNQQNENNDETQDKDFNSFTVPQLKDKLREAGLPVSGRKSELVARLQQLQ